MRRVIIDYYSQGHWIKLLSFPRDKLRGAGCFPVGLSETFYAAFSKNYQERIGRRNVRSQRPADSETAIPSKHSQNLDMQKTQMRRGAWARFSGTRGCGFKTGDAGAYHVGLLYPWNFRLRNFFHMRHARKASQALERRAGWTWLDSGERPNAFHGLFTFLILLCSRSG